MFNGESEKAVKEAAVAKASGLPRSVQRISKFLRIVSDASMPNELGVMSNDNKLIAIIGYYKPWREWVLYPEPKTMWSADCLMAIKTHLSGMMKASQ
jgi:hypothetical protein